MDGYVTIGTKLDTKSFDAQITQLEKKLETLEKSADESNIPKQFRRSAEETANLNAEIEKTRNQLSSLYKKQNELNTTGFAGVKNSLDSVGSSVQKVIKKVVKWGLAIFGIRSAYMLVRQSVSTLSQYDDQLASNLEYIRYAIAVALKPVIEYIVSLVYKLLAYVNYLAKAWFKIDLFANASAQGFKDAKNNAKGLNKELNKTIAGFDEMNTLQSNNGADTGVALPSFDLSKMEDVKIPKWLEWIKDHGAEIATAIGLIIGSKILGTGLLGLTGLASTLATIGVIAIGVDLFYKALTGRDLVQDLKDIYNGFKELEKAKKNNEKMDKEIAETTTNIVKNNKEVAKSYEKGSQEIARMTGALRSNIETSQKEIESGRYSQEQIKRRNKLIQESIETYKSLYEQGKLTNGQTEDYIELMGQLGLKADGTKMSFKEYTDFLKNNFNSSLDISKEKANALYDKLNELSKKKFGVDIQTKFGVDASAIRNILNNFKNMGIAKYFGMDKIIDNFLRTIPNLASGGIINMPSRGVPVGGAIAGEAGAEGVIPLTDSQQMSLLGEAIGKYITVNLTNITELDGRQIARKVDKIAQNNNFVLNR